MFIKAVQADITKLDNVDAIVNAAKNSLLGGLQDPRLQYRFREMVYRADFYEFDDDDCEEWFHVGIFSYNISRMRTDIDRLNGDSDTYPSILNLIRRTEVSVAQMHRAFVDLAGGEDEYVEAADLDRPIIFVEIAPDEYVLVDGNHRLEKAHRLGIPQLPAAFFPAHLAVRYLRSEKSYATCVGYWNDKVAGYDQSKWYAGRINVSPSVMQERDLVAEHIWNRLCICLNECRRVELYDQGTDKWFTLFRLNSRLYCGEAEAHSDTIKIKTPYEITFEMIAEAIPLYVQWQLEEAEERSSALKKLRKQMRHASEVMCIVRIFSEF